MTAALGARIKDSLGTATQDLDTWLDSLDMGGQALTLGRFSRRKGRRFAPDGQR